jgi:pimeloyl-ACP methyl ester carboxylesterase
VLPLRPAYFVRMAAVMLPAFVLSAEAKQKVFLGAYSPLTAPVIAQMTTPTDFRYNLYLPPVIADAELVRLSVPTLLLMGAQDIAYNPTAMLKRATRLIRQLETAVIPGAGHALNLDQPDAVNARILAFIQPAA